LELIFYVVSANFDKTELKYPCIILKRSSWDDYSYKTSFLLEFKSSEISSYKIGETKIAQIGQIGRTELPSQFNTLSDKYFSLGQTSEFYEQINKLDPPYNKLVLSAIQDLKLTPERMDRIRKERVFTSSLIRSLGALKTLTGDDTPINLDSNGPEISTTKSLAIHESLRIEFGCKLHGATRNIKCAFSFGESDDIPSRINVLIGTNGAGKTQLLANLVGAITGIGPTDEISESRAQISKVFTISYSVFDQFFMPNDVKIPHYTRRQDFLEKHARYDYIGVREKTKKDKVSRVVGPNMLSSNFIEAVRKIKSDNTYDEWIETMDPILREAELNPRSQSERVLSSNFKKMGAGHKVSISILTCLFSRLTENALVVVDEPENHLHPSLLASTMHALRAMLDTKKSYAIISTHSPIVVQEVPSRYVKILSKIQNQSTIDILPIESFGTSIDTLTSTIFGIHSEKPDYRTTLKKLAQQKYSLSVINDALGKSLSVEAASYFVSMGGEL